MVETLIDETLDAVRLTDGCDALPSPNPPPPEEHDSDESSSRSMMVAWWQLCDFGENISLRISGKTTKRME